MKINKKLLILTVCVTLIPIVVGLIFWEQLPDMIATHFGAENEANGWSSKAFAVFGIPLIMAALHIFCIVMTSIDPKKNNISKKAVSIVYWIVPLLSIFTMSAIYAMALGMEVNIGMICCLSVGILFILIGNYLPKVRQNYSFGVKTAWALESEENWNRSNRLAGWLYVICGFVFIINSFILCEWIVLIVIPITIIPMLYSYYLYKKRRIN